MESIRDVGQCRVKARSPYVLVQYMYFVLSARKQSMIGVSTFFYVGKNLTKKYNIANKIFRLTMTCNDVILTIGQMWIKY